MSRLADQLLDKAIGGADNALRTLFAPAVGGRRPNPASGHSDTLVDSAQRRHSAGLMRINQSGEVAAQGLYQGHAWVARDKSLHGQLEQASDEERDHLNWCTERLDELGARPSVLNGLWYGGAFALGALSGLAGDRWSLGFIAETEKQVVGHLNDHLQRLPAEDVRSREILSTMRDEEQEHGDDANNAGAAPLPPFVRRMMSHVARVMTRTAYWI